LLKNGIQMWTRIQRHAHSSKRFLKRMKPLVSKANVTNMTSKMVLWGQLTAVNLVEARARQFFRTTKMTITTWNNQIKEQNRTVDNSSIRVMSSGRRRVVIVSFGKMLTNEAKNSLDNRPGMSLMNFSILRRKQTSRVSPETTLKVPIYDKSWIWVFRRQY